MNLRGSKEGYGEVWREERNAKITELYFILLKTAPCGEKPKCRWRFWDTAAKLGPREMAEKDPKALQDITSVVEMLLQRVQDKFQVTGRTDDTSSHIDAWEETIAEEELEGENRIPAAQRRRGPWYAHQIQSVVFPSRGFLPRTTYHVLTGLWSCILTTACVVCRVSSQSPSFSNLAFLHLGQLSQLFNTKTFKKSEKKF